MSAIDISRATKRAGGALLAAALAAGCGGSGGGDGAIAPFWAQSGIIAADFNGDGRPDVAVATAYVAGPPPHDGHIELYFANEARGFDAPVRYPAGPDPWGLSAADVDGDGRLDLVVASPSTLAPGANAIADSGGVSILRQDPAQPGHFLAAHWLPSGGMAQDAAVADFDADGRADLVVADGVRGNSRAIVLMRDPAALLGFLAPAAWPLGTTAGAEDVAVGDVDGDQRLDVVLASGDSVVVLYRNASGGFHPAVPLAAGLNTRGVAVADLDGDGRADIAAANAGHSPDGGTGGASVAILLQSSPGQFVATQVPVADGARRVAVGDLDGDDAPDIAVVSLVYQSQSTPSRVSVLRQSAQSRGTFVPAGAYDGPLSADFITLADANGDAFVDIILDDGPQVLLQKGGAPGTFDALRPLR